MKRFDIITESDARVLPPGEPVMLARGGHVTPLAQDTLKERRIPIVDEGRASADEASLAPVAECRGRDGVPLALVGHHKREGQVDDDSGTAKQGEHDEADAVDRRMDVEVAGEPAGDPGDHPVGPASLQAPDVFVGECVGVFGHGSTMGRAGSSANPE